MQEQTKSRKQPLMRPDTIEARNALALQILKVQQILESLHMRGRKKSRKGKIQKTAESKEDDIVVIEGLHTVGPNKNCESR
jgi:hypothetical protein